MLRTVPALAMAVAVVGACALSALAWRADRPQTGAPDRFVRASGALTWSGSPRYAELAPDQPGGRAGVAGGGVSDYGSRSAIKATLSQARPMLAATYASFGRLGRKLDRSTFDITTPSGRPLAVRRSVRFAPWGWSEIERARGVQARGTALTVARDAFAFSLTLKAARPVRLRFSVFSDRRIDGLSEIPLGAPSPVRTVVAAGNTLERFGVARSYRPGPINAHAGVTTVWRAWRLRGLRVSGQRSGPGSFSVTAVSRPSNTLRVTAVIGVGLTARAAERSAAAGASRSNSDLNGIRQEWSSFLHGPAAAPRGAATETRLVYRNAMTALRMDLVAPAGRLQRPGTFPAKVSDPAFFGWDTPLNAVGMAEWGRWRPRWLPRTGYTLAEDMLLLQLDGQTPDGAICFSMEEDLRCSTRRWIQPPVQGWAAWRVARRDPSRSGSRRFLARAYDGLERLFDYVVVSHTARDGHLRAWGGAETWDDSPAASLRDGPWSDIRIPQPAYEPVIWPVWMSAYATAMAHIADRLGRTATAQRWHRRARSYAVEAEEHWSQRVGGWLDRRAGRAVDVRTPAMWWPAAFLRHALRARVQQVIGRHVLNAAEFASRTPTPSVAVDSRLYDRREHGSYVQGQSWFLFGYATFAALRAAGRIRDSEDLRRRMIHTAATHDGIFEAYGAVTGRPGTGPGASVPAAFGYGHSATSTVLTILRRDAG